MKSKLKNTCVVVERNRKFEKVIYDDFYNFKVKAKKEFLESEIISWSLYDADDQDQEVIFKVYVQRYLAHSEFTARLKPFESDDVSALLIIRINDEDSNDIRCFIDLTFHESFNDMTLELMKAQRISVIRMMKHRKSISLTH